MDDVDGWRSPHYRVEHRHPDLATIIVAFEDTPADAQRRLTAAYRAYCSQRGVGELVIVDQATGRDLARMVIDGAG